MVFKFHLSKPRTSLQAYIDFKFHISKPRTSSQAYFDLKLPFHSQSIIEKCELYVCCTPWKQQAANNNKNYICTECWAYLSINLTQCEGTSLRPRYLGRGRGPAKRYVPRVESKIPLRTPSRYCDRGCLHSPSHAFS